MPHKRSRTGCLTCRQDGYKCDEEKPACRRCVRLAKECPGYGVQLKWRPVNAPRHRKQGGQEKDSDSPRSDSTGSLETQSRRDTPQVRSLQVRRPFVRQLDPLPSDMSLLDRRLLHHWTSTLASMVSMASAPANNPFLTHLTPLIIETPALRSAVLSMSASHLSSLEPNDSSMDVVSRRHRVMSVASLRNIVGTAAPEVSLATILMLQLSDRLFIGADDSPANHLNGAKAVIASQPGRWAKSEVGTFLLGVYLYQDVLASVMRGSSPLLDLEDGIMVEGLDSLSRLTRVLRVVGQISRMREMEQTDLLEYATDMYDLLTLLEDPNVSSTQDEIGATAEAYRQAAFIYLYRAAYNIGAPHPLTLEHVDGCLRLLSRIPTTSSMLSSHVWPIWTAGCESIDPSHRDFVRARLDEMYRHRKLPSLRRVRCDMEEIWKAKDEQRNSTGTDKIDCIKTIIATHRRTADLI